MVRLCAFLLVAVAASTLLGCRQPAAVRAPQPVRIQMAEPQVTEGSLWQSDTGSTGLIADQIARKKGDLVTILVVEDVNAKRDRSMTTSRKQSADAAITSMGFSNWNFNGELPKVAYGSSRDYSGGGSIEDSGQVRATISAQVTETLPNGYLVLLGQKEVIVAGETQVVTLTGIARPNDILPNNTITSNKLAEARVNIFGSGPLNDAQRRTLVGRLLDWINLF
jgi:flagellar L-ring protein precursor FlgH